jgi:hypothetical protein
MGFVFTTKQLLKANLRLRENVLAGQTPHPRVVKKGNLNMVQGLNELLTDEQGVLRPFSLRYLGPFE